MWWGGGGAKSPNKVSFPKNVGGGLVLELDVLKLGFGTSHCSVVCK